MAVYVCVACAVGDCDSCHGQVQRGSVVRDCSCRHGEPMIVRTGGYGHAGGTLTRHADGRIVLDTRNAVLLDTVTSAEAANPSDGRTVAALFLEGRLNLSGNAAAILYLLGPGDLALLVAEAAGLAARIGPDFEARFRSALDERIDAAGLWPAVVPAGRSDGS